MVHCHTTSQLVIAATYFVKYKMLVISLLFVLVIATFGNCKKYPAKSEGYLIHKKDATYLKIKKSPQKNKTHEVEPKEQGVDYSYIDSLVKKLMEKGSTRLKSVQDKIFLSTVERETPHKGSAFPRIRGPSSTDKVCIVGAGPAGLHMALELKLRNTTNILIFEKSNRVGGKSFDYPYRGLDQPLGTIFLNEEYFDNLIPLARQYGAGDLVKFVKPAIINNSNSLELTEYIGRGAAGLLLSFIDAIRYINLHKKLFGTYKGELMPRPSPTVLYRIRGTFLQFLKRENLLGLAPFFKLSQTVQGRV